jgi:hypothetical protein
MPKFIVFAFVLLILLQHAQYHAVQGQRTLVSLSKKLKFLTNSDNSKKKTSTANAPIPFDEKGKGYFWDQDWNLNFDSDDTMATCITLLLVVFSAILVRLRALGE